MDLRFHGRTAARAMALAAAGFVLCAGLATQAAAAPRAHGNVVHIVKPGLGVNANQSSNWFGYNQGTLEQGGAKQFHSITGDWTVPTVSRHRAGQAAASSDWIGIGGGCVDANCTVGDNTLIQTGTEQDVSASGVRSYSAWYELIPAPSLRINMTVRAGDHMHAQISEMVPGSNVWKITLRDVTRNETFTTTVPYASTHATAEWIEETPLVIGTNAGLAPLPNLSRISFDRATTNGASARLKSSEKIQLIDGNGHVIGTPSAPDAQRDGFAVCAWATSC
jgi:peptidase A4-like protein